MAHNTWIVAAVLSTATGVLLAGQQPTFRAVINYVELPVRVLDGKGEFVRDLSQADFHVLEDGKPQTIADFTLVDLPLPPPRATPGTPSVSAAVPPTAANPAAAQPAVQIDGRIYLLILDDARVRPQYSSQFRRIVSGFVRDHMAGGDLAGVVFTSGVKGQDFTADRTALIAAIDGFIGRFDGDLPRQSAVQGFGAAVDEELFARATLKTIADVSRSMAAVKQRHKAVLYLSSTIGCVTSRMVRPDRPPPVNAINSRDTNPGSEGESGRLGSLTPLCGETIWSTARAAIQADVSFYAIDPRGVQDPSWVSPKIDGRGGPDRARSKAEMVEGGPQSVFDGMRVLADSTGGFFIGNVNNFDKAFDRIVRENSSYYLIGYYSTNDKADGSPRKNDVKLAHKGLQVLYRASYIAPRN